MSPSPAPRLSVERQLISNQIWESVAFVAKAAFMLGLTPWMLHRWGSGGYGEFALASSAFALLSILDFGIRGHTRLALCRHRASSAGHTSEILGQSVFTFAVVALTAIGVAAIFTASGVLGWLFKISAGSHHLLLLTTVMTMLVLVSGLMLEPLIASGNIGRVKLATAAGWLLATPAVAAVLWSGGGVTLAVLTWLASLFLANAFAVLSGGVLSGALRRSKAGGAELMMSILRQGFWFNATNVTWLARTYGATLLISALDGPVTAGVFFILLRLSEIISALGAISSDVSLGELAQAQTADERQRSFRSTYSWAALLCVHASIVIGFLTPDFFQLWLRPASPPPPLLGLVVVALGLGSALNRTATYAALGLGLGRTAARWGLVETLLFVAALFIFRGSESLLPRLAWASAAALALIPLTIAVSRGLSAEPLKTWLRPLRSHLPGALASAAVLSVATYLGYPGIKLLALTICGGIVILNVLSLAMKQPVTLHTSPESAVASQIAC